ncbi:LuxR C-terminal-related transcriptional regulator [Demequina sp. NBRC 110056]|uniref:LuxR C-terminal-related transcriptional regulator n=1 Tax=Demequina sp. NBRC 110056 TaxID=1570345 RepID=UPI00190EB890|nr:LuxR C-terminal-related transcriptional regulator [Demequina sp. NBRC 110056]
MIEEARREELALVRAWARDPDTAILTLTGLPGSGRRALAAAAVADLPPADRPRIAGAADDVSGTTIVISSAPTGRDGERVIRLAALGDEASVEHYRHHAARAGARTADLAEHERAIADIAAAVGGHPGTLAALAAHAAAHPPRDTAAALEARRELDLVEWGDASAWAAELTGAVAELSADARAGLDVLAALDSGVTLDDLVAIAGTSRKRMARALEHLVNAHLVLAPAHDDATRYRVDPLVRRLLEASWLPDVPTADARAQVDAWITSLARHAGSSARSEAGFPHPAIASVAVDVEASLLRAIAERRSPDAAALLAALGPLWLMHSDERGARLAGDVVALLAHDESPAAFLARAWEASLVAELAQSPGDVDRIDAANERWVSYGDSADPVTRLRLLALVVRSWRGSLPAERMHRLCDEGRELAETLRDQPTACRFDVWTGMIHHASGEADEARAWAVRAYDRALAADDLGMKVVAAALLRTLPEEVTAGDTMPEIGDIIDAAERIGDERTLQWFAPYAIRARMAAGDVSGAGVLLDSAVAKLQTVDGWRWPVTPVVVMFAGWSAARRDWESVALADGGFGSRIRAISAGLPPAATTLFEQSCAGARAALGDDGWRTATAQAMLLDHAALLARMRSATSAPPDEGPRRRHDLTAREEAVLAALAEGLSNKQIAARLLITPKTVMHHTSAIYRKLGVTGRAGAAAWATSNPRG